MKNKSSIIFIIALGSLFLFGLRMYKSIGLVENINEQDIYYSYIEGQRILNGENPYIRVLTSDMRTNNKFATYFPLFYESSYVSQMFGLVRFSDWLSFWRRVFFVFNLGTALLLYWVFSFNDMRLLGLFAVIFWLFNRWTLIVVHIAHLDFIPIFFLIASLVLFQKSRQIGLLLFSISLAFKQIGIFILPLFLIWSWHSIEKNRVRGILSSFIIISSVPFLASIPFLIWNTKGFLYSTILFSLSRFSGSHFVAKSLDAYLGWDGIVGRLPMLILFLLIYWLSALRYFESRYIGAFLIMSVFIGFNAVLYVQYMLWLVPLTALLLLDVKENNFIHL